MVPDDNDDPYITTLIFIGLGLCGGVFLMWLFRSSADAGLQEGAGWCNGLLVLGGVGTLVSWLHWRKINRRRQAAASGIHGGAPLAAMQPFPDEAALAPHAVIVHKRSLLREVMWFVEIYIGGCVLLAFIADFPLRSREWAAFFIDIRSSWPYAVGYLVGLGMRSFLHSPYTRLQIDASGLMLSTPTKTKLVRWDEARLFAVRGPRTPFSKAVTYELASAKEVITWKPLRRLHWWSIQRPTIPFVDYQWQMAALLSLIAARTHLPLYDVRQEAR